MGGGWVLVRSQLNKDLSLEERYFTKLSELGSGSDKNWIQSDFAQMGQKCLRSMKKGSIGLKIKMLKTVK